MIAFSLISILALVSIAKADNDCDNSVDACMNDPICSNLLNSFTNCVTNTTNTAYGCDIYQNDTSANPGYGASCTFNCYSNVAATSNNTNFQFYGNCLLYNVTLEPTFMINCNQQRSLLNCVNVTQNNLTCAANVNTEVNCYNSNGGITPPAVCALTGSNTPGYDAACAYYCNTTVQNPTPAYSQLFSCALEDLLVFPNCNTYFSACLQDTSNNLVCLSNLNNALVNAQNATQCNGLNSSTWTTATVNACTKATFGAINSTANNTAWNNLQNCVTTIIIPDDNPSSGSSASSSSNTTSSSGSSIIAFYITVIGMIFSMSIF